VFADEVPAEVRVKNSIAITNSLGAQLPNWFGLSAVALQRGF
jgi:hypothetical protein